MVVAYGTAKKSSFTGSAAVVKNDKIEKMQTSDVTKALAGAVSGVQITTASGAPWFWYKYSCTWPWFY